MCVLVHEAVNLNAFLYCTWLVQRYEVGDNNDILYSISTMMPLKLVSVSKYCWYFVEFDSEIMDKIGL
jgi:hypothetical protein